MPKRKRRWSLWGVKYRKHKRKVGDTSATICELDLCVQNGGCWWGLCSMHPLAPRCRHVVISQWLSYDNVEILCCTADASRLGNPLEDTEIYGLLGDGVSSWGPIQVPCSCTMVPQPPSTLKSPSRTGSNVQGHIFPDKFVQGHIF